MQEMAMLSQAHKCFASSFLPSSCTRLSLPRAYLRDSAVGNWRRELGFATRKPAGQAFGARRTCGRLLVTGNLSSCGKGHTEIRGLRFYTLLTVLRSVD